MFVLICIFAIRVCRLFGKHIRIRLIVAFWISSLSFAAFSSYSSSLLHERNALDSSTMLNAKKRILFWRMHLGPWRLRSLSFRRDSNCSNSNAKIPPSARNLAKNLWFQCCHRMPTRVRFAMHILGVLRVSVPHPFFHAQRITPYMIDFFSFIYAPTPYPLFSLRPCNVSRV